MADILKITTPLINKSQPMDPKRPVDVNTQFDIHNVNRVVKPATQEEILAQNNGLNQQEGTSEMLLSLLKDPSVAASSLKNLYLMQELIKLLPVNNETFTKEIQQLFDQMFVSQEEIAPEMLRQEQITTVFKGEMFDFLRELLGKYPDQRDLRASVVSFLKALNQHGSRGAMLESVANSLEFLSESLASSHSISERLMRLAQRFRQPGAMQNFDNLKRGALALFKEVGSALGSYDIRYPIPQILVVVLVTAALLALGVFIGCKPFPAKRLQRQPHVHPGIDRDGPFAAARGAGAGPVCGISQPVFLRRAAGGFRRRAAKTGGGEVGHGCDRAPARPQAGFG